MALDAPPGDLSAWQDVVTAQQNPEHELNLAFVGKYLDLLEAYKSLIEAITHAGIQTRTKININYIDAEELERNGVGRAERRPTPFWCREDSGAAALRAKFSPLNSRGNIACAVSRNMLRPACGDHRHCPALCRVWNGAHSTEIEDHPDLSGDCADYRMDGIRRSNRASRCQTAI